MNSDDDFKNSLNTVYQDFLGINITDKYCEIKQNTFWCKICKIRYECVDLKGRSIVREHLKIHNNLIKWIDHCDYKGFTDYTIDAKESKIIINGEHFKGTTKTELDAIIDKVRPPPPPPPPPRKGLDGPNLKDEFVERVQKRTREMLEEEVEKQAKEAVNKILQDF